MHGGTVEAHSAGLGQGSEFVVRLTSTAPPPADDAAEAVEEAATATPRRILVVDDNADAAQSLAMLLRLRGHKANVAFSGSDALRMVQDNPPELVFLDIGMPDLDGYEVARRLRADSVPS